MKTLWNGSLHLGEIAIPVGLASTVRDRDSSFRKLHDACKTRIAFRPYCERDEQLVDADSGELVTAWEVAKGEYIVLDEKERAVLEPAESRAIPIGGFVKQEELDPLLVRKRYYLVPSSTVGRSAYAVLAEAMHELEVAGVVRFVAWSSEQQGAVISNGVRLELAMLHFAEDLVPVDDALAKELAAAAAPAELVELMRELVERHTRPLKPADLASVERPRVRQLLDRKLAGEKIVTAPVDEPVVDDIVSTPPVELESALKRSIKQAPRRRRTAAHA